MSWYSFDAHNGWLWLATAIVTFTCLLWSIALMDAAASARQRVSASARQALVSNVLLGIALVGAIFGVMLIFAS